MSSRLVLDNCFSCNRSLSPTRRGNVKFPCPECGARIVRCTDCRRRSNSYTCPGCKFVGP